jgi:hypothetical protein
MIPELKFIPFIVCYTAPWLRGSPYIIIRLLLVKFDDLIRLVKALFYVALVKDNRILPYIAFGITFRWSIGASGLVGSSGLSIMGSCSRQSLHL